MCTEVGLLGRIWYFYITSYYSLRSLLPLRAPNTQRHVCTYLQFSTHAFHHLDLYGTFATISALISSRNDDKVTCLFSIAANCR